MHHDDPAQPAFPIGQTVAWLTATAAVLGAAGALVAARQFPGESDVMRAVIGSAAMVWLVSLASLWVVYKVMPRGAQTTALVHFAGAGGRALLCLLLGLFAVYGLGLPIRPVLFTAAALYLPLVVIESFMVARFVRAAYEHKLGVQS